MTRLVAALALLGVISSAHSTPEKDAAMAEIGQAVNEGRMADAYRMSLPYAQAGDRDMELSMALFLESGQDVGVKLAPEERDALERRWLGRAALHGQPESMKWLSEAFRDGTLGLAKNAAASKCWADARASRVAPSACASTLGSGHDQPDR